MAEIVYKEGDGGDDDNLRNINNSVTESYDRAYIDITSGVYDNATPPSFNGPFITFRDNADSSWRFFLPKKKEWVQGVFHIEFTMQMNGADPDPIEIEVTIDARGEDGATFSETFTSVVQVPGTLDTFPGHVDVENYGTSLPLGEAIAVHFTIDRLGQTGGGVNRDEMLLHELWVEYVRDDLTLGLTQGVMS